MRYALSGKIKCFYDGATFIKGSYKNRRTGMISKYWGCSNYRKYGKEKANGCNTPIIHYEELLDIFKKMANTFLNKESDIIKEIYDLISETKAKKDYAKEISDIDKKIEDIKSAKAELINMRARKEIEREEYNIQREKYNSDLNILGNKNEEYLVKSKEDNYKDSIDNFYKKIKDNLLEDDESVFRIFGSIIDTIYVEKFEKDDNIHKVVLHFKLNILSHNDSDLNLNNFLLLFGNNDRCRSSAC
jgi:hypothetical protein